jgi:20S proteasome subunit beta 2
MEFRTLPGDAVATATAVSPDEALLGREVAGFDFSNRLRNTALESGGAKPPKAMKTGTTICGVVFSGGVVLGADTRATEGSTVADKNCEKIHYIAPNIYCCGAGTAADTENITQVVSSSLNLLRLSCGRQSRVVGAMTQLKRRLFRYQGHVSAALVLGGVDATGPHLYTIYPHGSTDKLPFVTMGSGSLAAMAMMEAGYRDNMTEQEAKDLVHRAIRAGIFNDLGSGSNVDLCVIRADSEAAAGGSATATTVPVPGPAGAHASEAAIGVGVSVSYLRSYETPNDVAPYRAAVVRPDNLRVPAGATAVLKERFQKLVQVRTLQ